MAAAKLGVSLRTVKKAAAALGWKYKRRPRGTPLTSVNIARRLELAEGFDAQPNLTRLIFSDEKLFDCNDYQDGEWVPSEESPSVRVESQGAPRLLVWGAIGIGFKYLHFCGVGTMNGERFFFW